MHVLILPSEEFLPEHSHLAGIFQKHQATALLRNGCKVGVLSVRQSLSVPMILKAMLFRLLRKKINNELTGKTIKDLLQIGYAKIFKLEKFITKESIEGLPVYRIDGFYFLPPGKHSNHYGWLKAGMKIWEAYCKEEGVPDIIHAHNAVYAGILASKIRDKYKVPFVITEHSSYVARNIESAVIRSSIASSYQLSSALFVVSRFLGEKLDEVFGRKFVKQVVPNVLDPFFEDAAPPQLQTANHGFQFAAIGSLIPIKRHSDLINAFHLAFAGNKSVVLKIAGDGDLKDHLQEQISQLQLQQQVQILDRLNRQEVLSLLDASNSLVLCSEMETFGVVLIEALSRGLPAIATRCGGPESILTSENGLLCDVGDVSGLANTMQTMIETYEQYNHNRIRKEALEKYGSQTFANQVTSVYTAIKE